MATEPPCGKLGDELDAEFLLVLLPHDLKEVLAQLILQHLCPAVHPACQNNLKETKSKDSLSLSTWYMYNGDLIPTVKYGTKA
jgi:hypothetical protein